MGRKKKDQGKNTKIGVYFFIFILGIIFISLLFKGLLIVKNSKFQDDSRFNFLISNNKESEIISFLLFFLGLFYKYSPNVISVDIPFMDI